MAFWSASVSAFSSASSAAICCAELGEPCLHLLGCLAEDFGPVGLPEPEPELELELGLHDGVLVVVGFVGLETAHELRVRGEVTLVFVEEAAPDEPPVEPSCASTVVTRWTPGRKTI